MTLEPLPANMPADVAERLDRLIDQKLNGYVAGDDYRRERAELIAESRTQERRR